MRHSTARILIIVVVTLALGAFQILTGRDLFNKYSNINPEIDQETVTLLVSSLKLLTEAEVWYGIINVTIGLVL